MNGQSTSTQLDPLHAAKAEAVARYLKPNGNIVGVGIGKKPIDKTQTDCVRIYVVLRQDESAIPPSQVVPKGMTLYDVPVEALDLYDFAGR